MKTVLTLVAVLGAAGSIALAGAPDQRQSLPQEVPYYKYTQTLVASTDCGKMDYLMAPIQLRVDEHRLLFGYKRGTFHYGDDEAWFEVGALDPVSQRLEPVKVDLRRPHLDFQDGEFARFANGDIACYLDVQSPGSNAVRQGLLEYRSSDEGRSFRDAGKVGLVDGVEYGYAFEAVTRGRTTWMLVMRFTNLPGGGKAVFGHHGAGSVDVIRTEDNGHTWHFVRNLTEEFHGYPVNESSFVSCGDGFIVVTRGYDNRVRVQSTDLDFKLRRQVDLNATYAFINSYLGRPRVFEHEGRYYLMGRNWTKPGTVQSTIRAKPALSRSPGSSVMQLSFFRIDPGTDRIDRAILLDNAEEEQVIDGYYAVPYWQERDGHEYFDVITYKRMAGRFPDILRLEFDWAELK